MVGRGREATRNIFPSPDSYSGLVHQLLSLTTGIEAVLIGVIKLLVQRNSSEILLKDSGLRYKLKADFHFSRITKFSQWHF